MIVITIIIYVILIVIIFQQYVQLSYCIESSQSLNSDSFQLQDPLAFCVLHSVLLSPIER